MMSSQRGSFRCWEDVTSMPMQVPHHVSAAAVFTAAPTSAVSPLDWLGPEAGRLALLHGVGSRHRNARTTSGKAIQNLDAPPGPVFPARAAFGKACGPSASQSVSFVKVR